MLLKQIEGIGGINSPTWLSPSPPSSSVEATEAEAVVAEEGEAAEAGAAAAADARACTKSPLRVFLFTTDAGPHQLASDALIKADTLLDQNTLIIRQLCLRHQTALIVKRQFMALGEYWGCPAKMCHVWRATHMPSKIFETWKAMFGKDSGELFNFMSNWHGLCPPVRRLHICFHRCSHFDEMHI
jgi:hypothetical protein